MDHQDHTPVFLGPSLSAWPYALYDILRFPSYRRDHHETFERVALPRPDLTDRKPSTASQAAGRPDPSHAFSDLRSTSKAAKRTRRDREKYYFYRGVNRGQLEQQYYDTGPRWPHDKPYWEYAVTKMTKQQLYEEAQNYPRPPKHHRSRRYCCWTAPQRVRQRQEECKHPDRVREMEGAEMADHAFMYYVHGGEACEVCVEQLRDEDLWADDEVYYDGNGDAVVPASMAVERMCDGHEKIYYDGEPADVEAESDDGDSDSVMSWEAEWAFLENLTDSGSEFEIVDESDWELMEG